MEQYIGRPYTSVPNPFDTEHENYAKYFEDEFMKSIKKFGIEMDYQLSDRYVHFRCKYQ